MTGSNRQHDRPTVKTARLNLDIGPGDRVAVHCFDRLAGLSVSWLFDRRGSEGPSWWSGNSWQVRSNGNCYDQERPLSL